LGLPEDSRSGAATKAKAAGGTATVRRLKMEVREVQLGELDLRWSGLRLCSPETEAWLAGSVEQEGLRESLVASSGVEAGKLVLVDGFKRLRVLQALGWEQVPVRVLTADTAACLAAMLALNRARRGLRDIEEGWLVKSLCRGCGLKQQEAGELLGRHKSWVCRRLKLVEHLDEWVQDEIRLGLLAASTAREIVRLPRGNQLGAAHAVREHGLSSRQAARLVTALVGATPDAEQALLADPLRYVAGGRDAVLSEPQPDPRLTAGGNRIRERLYWLERDAKRMVDVCNGHAVGPLPDEDAVLLLPVLLRTVRECERAVRTLRRVIQENGGVDERRTGETDVRGAAAAQPGGIAAGDQPCDGAEPADRPQLAAGGPEATGGGGLGIAAGAAAVPDAEGLEAGCA